MKIISFIQFLIEIGNSSYDFEDKYPSDYSYTKASFSSKNSGDEYETRITNSDHNPHKAEILFGNKSKNMWPSTKIEGNEKNSSHRIFGTVKHIIQHHLKKNPIVTHITFSADPGGGREKLYHHFAKSIDPNYSHWKREYNKGTEFEVNVSKLRNHINEGKVIKVSQWQGNLHSIKVFKNPSNEQVKNQPLDVIRTLKHGNDHYVWDAHDSDHSHMSDSLGIPYNDTQQGIFTKEVLNDRFNGDYKKAHEASHRGGGMLQ